MRCHGLSNEELTFEGSQLSAKMLARTVSAFEGECDSDLPHCRYVASVIDERCDRQMPEQQDASRSSVGYSSVRLQGTSR